MSIYGRSTRRVSGVVLGPAVRFAKSDGENLTKGQQVCFGDWFVIRFRLPDDLSRGRLGLGLVREAEIPVISWYRRLRSESL